MPGGGRDQSKGLAANFRRVAANPRQFAASSVPMTAKKHAASGA
jgi:hypothetical protein